MREKLIGVCSASALLRMCFGVCNTVFIQEATETQGLVAWLKSACTPSAFWCLWDMGKYGLVGVNRAFHSGALTLVCFGFRDRVSLVLAVTGLGSPFFSLSNAKIIGWSGHVRCHSDFDLSCERLLSYPCMGMSASLD